MNVIFRADANYNIGIGHIMRCLSIADSCSAKNYCVKFIIAGHDAESLIKNRGYEVEVLSSDYSQMDDELNLWSNTNHPDIIVIDSYFVTSSYFLKVKKTYKCPIVYIDDLYSHPYPVDILINYNAYALEIDYDRIYSDAGIECPQLILGPTFAPLRQMFKGLQQKKQKETVENILIAAGGSDEFHLALAFVETINNQNPFNLTYHILLGALNQDKEEIRAKVSNNKNIVLHENVSDMKTLIQSMDIVISAAGSTLYEVCACGVPLITYILADNQIPGAQAFDKLGLALNIGDLRDSKSKKDDVLSVLRTDAITIILNVIRDLSHNFELRKKMALQMQKTVDGFGADRIANAILDRTSKKR